MNLAIYAKPKVGLDLSNSNDVKWWDIKPLIIKNVQVLAKKKKKLRYEGFF